MRSARLAITALLFGLTVVFLVLWWRASNDLKHLKQEVRYADDARFEEAAYREAARYEALPIAKIRDYFLPITMTYNQKACVELRPRWNVMGGHTIYCFDLKTGALIGKERVRG